MERITMAISEEFERLSTDLKECTDRCFAVNASDPSAEGLLPGPGLACLIRAAATIEQAFGGLNAQLWDDPYEWTLPEAMGSRERVLGYLAEVDSERRKGFERITGDHDLKKDLWTPWGTMSITELLLRALSRARTLQGRGAAAIENA